MEKAESVIRVERDLAAANRNLARAVERNAPQQDITNLRKKIAYLGRIHSLVELFWDAANAEERG